MNISRPLSIAERSITKWMLEHGGRDNSKYLLQLDKATVIRTCDCGCASVDFQIQDLPMNASAGLDILSDYLYKVESEVFGIFVFAKDEVLAGLEVYSCSGESTPKTLPETSSLIPFEKAANLA
jgi:hypothetical protein